MTDKSSSERLNVCLLAPGTRRPWHASPCQRVISQWPDTFTATVSDLIRRNAAASLSLSQGFKELIMRCGGGTNKRLSHDPLPHHHHRTGPLTLPLSPLGIKELVASGGMWNISCIHSVHATHPALLLAAGQALITGHMGLKGCSGCGIISLLMLSVLYKSSLYN